MTRDEVFERWAPPDERWSPWVKPVVFAHLNVLRYPLAEELQASPPAEPPLDVDADGTTTLVIDLPGAIGVELGLAFALQGFRPIPVYNAVPAPLRPVALAGPIPAMVDMRAILAGVVRGAGELASLQLPSDAPPAFLLDSRRRVGDPGTSALPGVFDNRSVSLPTDFPSGNLLRSHGIARAIVIVAADAVPAPQADLAHTLRRWQDAGVTIELFRLGEPGATPQPIVVRRPPWYRSMWHAMLARMGLRRHALGGFGGVLPEPSASGA
jgi:hypothetical protein